MEKQQQRIVKILYMGILCITLTEGITNRFVQNWHSPKSPSTEWSWFLIEFVTFSLFAMYSWIIAIFKECMIKGRNFYCLYIHKLYFNASKLYQKWKKLQNLQCFQVQKMYLFYISKLNNAIYIMLRVPSIHYKHHVVLFIFTNCYLKQKISSHFHKNS